MFIRLHLRVSNINLLNLRPTALKFIQPQNQIFHSKRIYSDVKTNEDLLFSNQKTEAIPSGSKIKQVIKTGFYDFVDGFTCIQTKCPVCPSDVSNRDKMNEKHFENQKVDKKHLFINKITGKWSIFPQIIFIFFKR